ncbi:Aldo/keto reductase [Epithele typhae]|uniref:Aldo/keto reductase n=1 Tax=Epithele typhae TaxID=378194 RepID=UPI0020087392|nr:Aldo/keto reductase [Epithele typhae]KAH9945083.1 Aldo/keto reductase [Epithele typhae]
MSQPEYLPYETKGMPFRLLGNSGLRVPIFSLGGWVTIGGSVKGDLVKDIMKTAWDNGINMFDCAESYAGGQSEIEMGRVIKELNLRRSDFIITTKIFWGTRRGPNDMGLSRKHIIEGTKESLARLQLDYVDVVFAHRADHTVPMEEVVRAFNWVVDKGYALYWATSEWSSQEIEEAHHIATRLNLIGPIAEQCSHRHVSCILCLLNMLHRERPEREYAPLYRKYHLGTTVFSALAQGILTGKYNDGIPQGSRLDIEQEEQFKEKAKWLQSAEGQKQIETVRKLTAFAESELKCKVSHLALAWIAANPHTSTVILGASKPEQVLDNLEALKVIPRLTPEVLEKIEKILDNKPAAWPIYGRPALDPIQKWREI